MLYRFLNMFHFREKYAQQNLFFVFVLGILLVHLCIVKRNYLKIVKQMIIRRSIQLLLTCAILLQLTASVSAQSWQKSFGTAVNSQDGKGVVSTKDGGYLVVYTDDRESSGSFQDLKVLKIDADGNKQWDQLLNSSSIFSPSKIVASGDDNFVIIGKQKSAIDYDPFIMKISSKGKVLWGPINFGVPGQEEEAASIVVTNNNEYIVAGNRTLSATNNDIFWLKFNADGQILTGPKTYSSTLKEWVNCITQSPDGGFVMVGKASHPVDPDGSFILKTDAALEVDAVYKKGPTTLTNFGKEIYAVVALGGENYFFITLSDPQNHISIINARITSTGVISQSSKTFTSLTVDALITNQIAITPDGNALLASRILETVNVGQTDFVILKANPFTCDSFWTKRINLSRADVPYGIIPTPVNGAVMVGSIDVGGGFAFPNVLVAKIDAAGIVNNSIVFGTVYNDENGNCTFDSKENYLKGWIIKSVGSKTYYATTDTAGYYQLVQDTGSYVITAIPPSKYWTVCQSSYNVNLKNNTVSFSFAGRSNLDCPDLEVDISTPVVKHCSTAEYDVKYYNPGTAQAKDAYIVLEMDAKLSILGSSIPWSSQTGNTLRFDLGNLPAGKEGIFRVFTGVSCDPNALGQTYQVKAHIYPDTSCFLPNPNWDKSSIEVTAKCVNDSVRFNIINKGVAPTKANEINYEIVEDELIFLQKPIIKSLQPLESIELSFAADGGTYRIRANQSKNHPGLSRPTIAIEGCENAGATKKSKGFVTQYAEDDADLFVAVDNSESAAAPIALEKRGYPKGYSTERYIENATELKYVFSFTNESADTIKRVVIIDSLPSELAAESFRAGASTYKYKWELYGKGLVRFTIDSLRLLPNERGFVKFSIYPKPELPIGTKICNNAAVYFDESSAQFTNSVCHTIGRGFIKIITSNDEISGKHVDVKVYPNPILDLAIIDVQGIDLKEGRFLLYDLLGKLKYSQSIFSNPFQVSRTDLPSGIYVFKIESKGLLVNSGKVIIR